MILRMHDNPHALMDSRGVGQNPKRVERTQFFTRSSQFPVVGTIQTDIEQAPALQIGRTNPVLHAIFTI
jgi:hypothetical protein